MDKKELEKLKKEFQTDLENQVELENQIILEREKAKTIDELKQSCKRTNSYAQKHGLNVVDAKPNKKD